MESFLAPFWVLWAEFSVLAVLAWFAGGIFLVILLNRLGWLKRKNILYRIFVGLFYLYIPLSFLAVGFAHQSLQAYEKTLHALVDQVAKPVAQVISYTTEPLLLYIDKYADAGEKKSPRNLLVKLSNHVADESIKQISAAAPGLANWMGKLGGGKHQETLKNAVGDSVLDKLEGMFLSKVSETTGTSQLGIKSIWSNDLRQSLSGGDFITQPLKQLVSSHVESMLMQLYPLFALILALPFVEILLYQLLVGRKKEEMEESLEAAYSDSSN